MYVYIKSESHLYTVGFYDPQGNFVPESDHDVKENAQAHVHFLNGGGVVQLEAIANTLESTLMLLQSKV